MKILVTGFDPFGGEPVNSALEAVMGMADEIAGAQIIKLEIPTVFGLCIEKVREAILYTHKHGATVVKSNGMYSGDDNYIVFSVMNVKEIPKLMNILKQYPETFVYFSGDVRVQGDFYFKEEEIGRWIAAFK